MDLNDLVDMPDDEIDPELLWTEDEKLNYVKKVFGILSLQLLVTAAACFAPFLDEDIQEFFEDNFWIAILFSILGCTASCMMCCKKELTRRTPHNYLILIFFTLS